MTNDTYPIVRAQTRQGDVFLEPCEPPTQEGEELKPDDNGHLVLAHSETTGFKHFMHADQVKMRRVMGMIYVQVLAAGAMLEHAGMGERKHGTIGYEPGWYKFTHQRQLEADQIRDVAD